MKKYGILITILLILGLGIGFLLLHNSIPKSVETEKSISQTPTLYIHGYGGTANSTNDMIASAEKSGKAKKILTATVSPTGDVTYTGRWKYTEKNPIVQVIFKRNNAQIPEEGRWIGKITDYLKASYDIKKINLVTHSMGGSSAMYWAESVRKKSSPILNKFVPIADPINGVLGMDEKANKNYFLKNDEPAIKTTNYQSYYSKRKNFPSTAKVFVIYGDVNDGSNSDTSVSIASARSMNYLLKGQVKSYEELKITGENAQHSKLHRNLQVDKAVIQFLWGK
ncbi:alpha/beta hydrolase [Dellaglioa sp. P0083]|uniref:alpha/beta hydrolase n=1 Tax=Dellaglioa kimchii TaxID=3344667 RepID=UPI0038D51535